MVFLTGHSFPQPLPGNLQVGSWGVSRLLNEIIIAPLLPPPYTPHLHRPSLSLPRVAFPVGDYNQTASCLPRFVFFFAFFPSFLQTNGPFPHLWDRHLSISENLVKVFSKFSLAVCSAGVAPSPRSASRHVAS